MKRLNFTPCESKSSSIACINHYQTDHCNIEKFKKNDAVNLKPPKGSIPDEAREKFEFIRKGKVGDWVNFFKDEAKLKEFDQWIAKNNKFEIPSKYNL